MKQTFYSNGKLLITAEYVVLDGAKALALPTKFGQYLHVETAENNQISWKSFDSDGSIWFEGDIPFDAIQNKKLDNSESPIKNTLIEILHQAYKLNSRFVLDSKGYNVTTELTFPRFWGLGTSSTLINNIAQWLHIDAFELLRNSFGGSGYDIACAQNNSPIFYRLENLPQIEPVNFNPDFTKNLYFLYLNQKQNSRNAIASYRKKKGNIGKTISEISKITDKIVTIKSVSEFAEILKNHEQLMSAVLNTPTVKESLFPDFNGAIKSLGAWGGDFVLVITDKNPSSYFQSKGYETLIAYNDMIK